MAKDELALVDVMEKAKVYVSNSSLSHNNVPQALYYDNVLTYAQLGGPRGEATTRSVDLLRAHRRQCFHRTSCLDLSIKHIGTGKQWVQCTRQPMKSLGCYEVEL